MARAPQQQQEQPAENRFLAFTAWKKMNTKVARQNLPDDECAWAENLQPIAPNSWQSVNGAATALATLTGGDQVLRYWPANIGNVDYLIIQTVAGGMVAVNTASGAESVIFASASVTDADVSVWASQRILIADATKGYATWDGSLTVVQGGLSPNINVTNGGSGYSAPPTVGFTGGSGSGATATAVMGGTGSAQFVVAVNLTNPGTGYKAGDVITVTFTGANTTPATATARIWPFISGNRLDVFAGRVWIGNGRVLTFTGTAGYDDTNVANAAGSTTFQDADLSHFMTGIRNLNNYLYIFGDRSVRQIGSISVSSSITLFTPLTLASDIGTTFQQTIQSYNRLVLFANKAGVYGIFGASIRKISDDLDGIFQLVDFSLAPSASLNDVHSTVAAGGSIHCYMLLVKYMDPVQGTRALICMYQNNEWWLVSQGNSLVAIVPIFLASTQQWDTFGSSGGDVTQLLQTPGAAVSVLFKSALSFNKNPLIAKRLVRAGCAVTSGIAQNFTFTVETEQSSDVHTLAAVAVINWINNSGGVVTWQNNSLATVSFVGGGFRFPYTAAFGEGKVIGGTVSGSVQQFALNAMAFEYVEGALWGTIP